MSLRFESFASSSAGNLYRLLDSGSQILIECGLPYAKIQVALKHRVSLIECCLITHSHQDHCAGIHKLLEAGIRCFTSRETAKHVNQLYHHNLTDIKPGQWYDWKGWQIQPFAVDHDGHPGVLGFYIIGPSGESCLFASDFAYLKPLIPTGTTILALACNYDEELLMRNVAHGLAPVAAMHSINGHPSIETVEGIIEANRDNLRKCRAIYLLHCSAGNGNADEFVKRIEAKSGVPTFAAGRKP